MLISGKVGDSNYRNIPIGEIKNERTEHTRHLSKKELKTCKTMEDLVGKNGLMQRRFGDIIQQFLEAEIEEHLHYNIIRDEYQIVSKAAYICMALIGKAIKISYG